MTRRNTEGRVLVELLALLAGSSLLLLLAAHNLLPSAGRRSVDAAARGLCGRFRALAHRAMAEGRELGLLFPRAGDEPLREVSDGDGDGLSRSDVEAGRDSAGPAFNLATDFPGVRVGRPPWPSIPEPPPGGDRLRPSDPVVRFGRSRMATFDGEGHANPGSVFVTDGVSALCAVVVAGPTTRVRTWCYDQQAGSWRRR